MSSRLRIITWNVNGLRAALRAGFLGWLERCGADIVCLQETKAFADDLAGVRWPAGYTLHLNPAEKPGYSGTALLTRRAPLAVATGLGRRLRDTEGRVLQADFGAFILVNVYTPNAQRELTRLDYRVQRWDPAFRRHVAALAETRPVVFCGDLNVAHTELDIARPRENRGNSGFTDEERASFARLLDAGFVDTFRVFESGGGHYSWWSNRPGVRARNIGWRIDYVCVSTALRPALRAATLHPDVKGSDHCPAAVELELD